MVAKTLPAPLTRNQKNGFFASWGGWVLDGFNATTFALVLVPSLTELLPLSGIPVTPAATSFWGGLGFALFLVGWGLSTIWGPVADRFGRARTLMLTILVYAIFTFLAGFSQNVWELIIFRFLAGIGIGGEWAMGGTFVAEEWPESRRVIGAGYLHSGYYFGILLAALANYTIGVTFGWRAMFWVGVIPALLVAFIRYGVTEPERWKRVETKTQKRRTFSFLSGIFTREYSRRSWGNALMLTVAMIGLWAGTVYLPAAITGLATANGASTVTAAHEASIGVGLLSVFTIIGCLIMPLLAQKFGRRKTLGLFFLLMLVGIAGGFGWAFYTGSISTFFVFLPILGLGGADFAVFTLWLPEQYSTEVRATAFAFATSIGRFVGAIVTFIVGAGIAAMGTIGTPIAITGVAFVIGLFFLGMSPETKEAALPE